MHRLAERLLTKRVRIAVIGCGGTGSAVLAGLPYLHQSMLAFGHPHGLHVTLIDGDLVTETNCVRQPFTRAEVGLNKATVLATRANLFWGTDWEAVPVYLGDRIHVDAHLNTDIVIGCVDKHSARRLIARQFAHAAYWLDFGNDAETGQFVLGELRDPLYGRREGAPPRLPTALDLWPEELNAPDDDQPSCSAVEALTRQAPFVNQVLANHGLALLSRLFRYGQIEHHGAWVNLKSGRVMPMPVPPEVPPPGTGKGARSRRRKKRERVRA